MLATHSHFATNLVPAGMKLLADAVQPVFGDAHVKSATLDGLSASITLSLAPEPKSVKDDFATACAAYAQPASAGHSATGVVQLGTPNSGRTSALALQLDDRPAMADGADAKPHAPMVATATATPVILSI